jgi:diaminohydroxyphosphoribosylaminopyrimidine deaminase/5-amino-6-(5-phosphoribosylamino)uracil reductase
LSIAKKGIGYSRPNPSVGAVIVWNNTIIGEGSTSSYGGNHAEVNAINSVKDKTLFKEAIIYVTLEPCSHHGKTPPCADLIIKYQFKKVVIGCIDSNRLVAGKGVERLKKAGVDVLVGVLESECLYHHRRFFTVQEKNRPYIILKWAETKDGFIAPLSKEKQQPVWISNQYSQQLVHQWRSQEHAIMVGTSTVIDDNPTLNVRNWSGQNPVRVVLDRSLRIPKTATIFDKSVQTIVITDVGGKPQQSDKNLIFEEIYFSKNIAIQICDVLQKNKIQSVIIEGGLQTLQTFIDENLWDEARVFVGDKEFKEGVASPKLNRVTNEEMNLHTDILKKYRND